MAQAAAKTGAAPTAIIAIEQHFPQDQRIIVDDLAYAILPFVARGMVRLTRSAFVRDLFVKLLEKVSPGIWALMTCRKRYIDEKLIGAAGSIQAVVNLGAGFDTRAYRLPALASMPIWRSISRKILSSSEPSYRGCLASFQRTSPLCRSTSIARTWAPLSSRKATRQPDGRSSSGKE
jgi:hypothetical protein